MRGSQELAQLADLFRIGARTARQIAGLRPGDCGRIERLASEVEDMADQLDAIVTGCEGEAPIGNTSAPGRH